MTPVSAETALMTDDAAAHGARRLPLLGVLLAGALLLSACGGSPEGDAQAGSEESSASASASEKADGGSGEEDSSSDRSSSDGSSSESNGGSENDGDSDGDGAGEFVPATSEGPAQNVPTPERPPEVSRETSNGAEAAAEYWFELFEYARQSGQTQDLWAMAEEACSKCSKEIDHIENVFEQGAWYVDAEYNVDGAGFDVSDGRATGFAVVSAPPFVVYEEDGAEHPADSMDAARYQLSLEFKDDQWRVVDWVTTPEVQE